MSDPIDAVKTALGGPWADSVKTTPIEYPELVRPARDYADIIAETLFVRHLADRVRSADDIMTVIARAVREGYALGYGAAQR